MSSRINNNNNTYKSDLLKKGTKRSVIRALKQADFKLLTGEIKANYRNGNDTDVWCSGSYTHGSPIVYKVGNHAYIHRGW